MTAPKVTSKHIRSTRAAVRKVSRACDSCKAKKAKCNGYQPCQKCAGKGLSCRYDAAYTRGRPRTPPKASENQAATSPELDVTEVNGTVVDPTSCLSFLQRVQRRWSATETRSVAQPPDTPLPEVSLNDYTIPSPAENRRLVALFFDLCIATYHVLDRTQVESWLAIVENNAQSGNQLWKHTGRAKTAIVLAVLAFAAVHEARTSQNATEVLSDRLCAMSVRLIVSEPAPQLASAQARFIQVLFLLTTSRVQTAWLVFGHVLQHISSLGLHRRRGGRDLTDDEHTMRQLGIRTFWSAYILDVHLGTAFGRPRHFHDDDIDQIMPDSNERSIEALIAHAQIARITGRITREVYSIKNTLRSSRASAARNLIKDIECWHQQLPVHLRDVEPALLAQPYSRQATVIRLAHAHAVIHASRLFLLDESPHARECMAAAKSVLEIVDAMARESALFHSFWWTHYVAFCALVVTYARLREGHDEGQGFLELVDRCYRHLELATRGNSPSRRYAIILEEFRTGLSAGDMDTSPAVQAQELGSASVDADDPDSLFSLDTWQMLEWPALDGSLFPLPTTE